MSTGNYRANEPLYIVIVRDSNAESLLRAWARLANAQVVIENNRMKLYEHRSLNLFQIGWTHGWDNVVIWDTWNKRHLEII